MCPTMMDGPSLHRHFTPQKLAPPPPLLGFRVRTQQDSILFVGFFLFSIFVLEKKKKKKNLNPESLISSTWQPRVV